MQEPVTMSLILVATYRPEPNRTIKYVNWTMQAVLKTFKIQPHNSLIWVRMFTCWCFHLRKLHDLQSLIWFRSVGFDAETLQFMTLSSITIIFCNLENPAFFNSKPLPKPFLFTPAFLFQLLASTTSNYELCETW